MINVLMDQHEMGVGEASREVSTRLGIYTRAMESKASRALQLIDPFGRAGSALTTTGLGSLINTAALPVFLAERGVRAAKGEGFTKGPVEKRTGVGDIKTATNNLVTVATAIALAKMFDSMRQEDRHAFRDGKLVTLKAGDDGRWPWEIPGTGIGDVRVYLGTSKSGKDKMRDLKFRYIANSIQRALNMTGLDMLYKRYFGGATSSKDMVDSVQVGMSNFVTGRLGPHIKAGIVGITGTIPYRTSPESGLGFPAYFDNPEESIAVQQAWAAAKQMLPVYHKYHEEYSGESMFKHSTSTMGQGIEYFAKIFGFDFPIRDLTWEQRQMNKIPNEKVRRKAKAASGIVYRVFNIIDEDEDKQNELRREFIYEQVDKRFASEYDRAEALVRVMALYSTHASAGPLAVADRAIFEAMIYAMDDINMEGEELPEGTPQDQILQPQGILPRGPNTIGVNEPIPEGVGTPIQQ